MRFRKIVCKENGNSPGEEPAGSSPRQQLIQYAFCLKDQIRGFLMVSITIAMM